MNKLIKLKSQTISQQEFKELLWELNISIVEDYSSSKLKGITLKSEDQFLIIINGNLTDDLKKETINHEIIHVYNRHFTVNKSILEKEQEAKCFFFNA